MHPISTKVANLITVLYFTSELKPFNLAKAFFPNGMI